MLPILRMRTFRVVEDEDIIMPPRHVGVPVLRPLFRSIAAIAELGVVALSAERARDPQHGDAPAKPSFRRKPLSYAHIFAGKFGDRLYTSPRDSGEREGPNASALGGRGAPGPFVRSGS